MRVQSDQYLERYRRGNCSLTFEIGNFETDFGSPKEICNRDTNIRGGSEEDFSNLKLVVGDSHFALVGILCALVFHVIFTDNK